MGEQGVVRINVSIPRDLKRRIDAIEESVNWSAVATQAFEDKLLDLQSQRKAESMNEVIERLKAAAALEANEDYQDGFEAGQEWAKNIAKPKELRRAAEYTSSVNREAGNQYDWWDVDYPGLMPPFGATENFVFAVWPKRDKDREAPEQFWEGALGDDKHRVQDGDFFHGFGEGAEDVWNKVAGKI